MIQNDTQLQQSRDAATSLERSLALLKKDQGIIHPDRYALMASPILEDLRQIRQSIDDYLGVTSAIQLSMPLWLKLQGPELSLDNAPSSVVTSLIDILRVGVQTVAEYLLKGRIGARSTAKLKEACELRLAAWQPGSIQVGLQLPEPAPFLFEDMDLGKMAREALNIYLIGAAWVGSEEDVAKLASLLPDSEQRRVVLNQIGRLIPRPRGRLDSVELSGRLVVCPVRLRRESRERVRNAITKLVHEEIVRTEGILREIDLDERTFILRKPDADEEIRCAIPQEAADLLEIAKSVLDHRVAVAGTRRRDPTRRQVFPLQVREIDVVDVAEETAGE